MAERSERIAEMQRAAFVRDGRRSILTPPWRWGDVEDRKPDDPMKWLGHVHRDARKLLVDFLAERDAIRGDDRLSDLGQRDRLREAAEKARTQLSQLRSRKMASTAQEIAKRGESLRPVAPLDRDDLAGALRDWELRDFVRSLPADQRTETVRGNSELAEAVLRAPRELSGMHEAAFELLAQRSLEGHSAEALDRHRTLSEALETTSEVLRVVEAEIVREGRLPRSQPDEALEEPEPEPEAPPDPELERINRAARAQAERDAEAKVLEEQTARELAEAEERIKAEVLAERGDAA